MTKRIRPPKETLSNFYLVQGKPPSEIASLYGINIRTFYKWLKHYDIPRILLNRPEIKPDRKQLYQWYWTENLTLPQIAQHCGVSYPAVRQWFIKLDVPRRTNSQAQMLSNGTTTITPKLLREMYIDKEMSQSQIAKELSRSQTGIGLLLRQYKIPTRGTANVGPRNGMYGRTHTPEARAKIREANRKHFAKPGTREAASIKTAKQIAAGQTGKTHNKLETLFASILGNLSIEYTWQYRLGRYVYDFYLPESNTLIEVHGTFWHADPRFYPDDLSEIQQNNVNNDKAKTNRAHKAGYRLLTFWEHDVHNSPQEVVAALSGL